MAVRPIATSEELEAKRRGEGRLLKSYERFKDVNPAAYYYGKFKAEGNRYLRDDMWTEAAKRGETGLLIEMLKESNKFTSEGDFEKWESYEGASDYDGYKLALIIPTLDNKEKIERVNELTGDSFGEFTDKEWAREILEFSFQRYDAELIEASKANLNFFQKFGASMGAITTRLIAYTSDFFQDVFNIGEGLLNMFVNFSNDDDWGTRFLWAFSNDEEQFFEKGRQIFSFMAYDLERRYTSILSAEQAFEEGFRLGEGSNYIEMIDNSVGVGEGYVGWGKWWAGGLDAIGYMLPTMLIPGGAFGKSTKLIKQGTYYSGIASSNIKDTVQMLSVDGKTYKDLSAGIVVANAALKAGAQLAIEHALGAVMGFSPLDRLMGIGTKVAAKTIVDVGLKGAKAGLAVAKRVGKAAFKEGFEEVCQDLSDGIIDSAFGGEYAKRGVENFSISNLVDSFVIGALVSGVIGGVSNLNVLFPTGKSVGVDMKGELYKMGAFETLNFRQAQQTMAQWNNILNSKKASSKKKAEAALKMSTAMNTVGSVIRSMGMERAVKANEILTAQMDVEATREEAKKKLSDTKYAKGLYAEFVKANTEITKKYIDAKIEENIRKAEEKSREKLEKAGVTKIKNIVTKKTDPNDPDVSMDSSVVSTVREALSILKGEAIVGVDGTIVTKSDKIYFVDNKLLESKNIAKIVEGVALDEVRDIVKANLNSSQKKMLLDQYNKITGTEGTLEDAIDALLFDKMFYTKIMLLSGERNYQIQAIKMLATIDKLIKAKLSERKKDKTITDDAYNILMNKIYENMKAGLITYATQYVMLPLNEISNEVLSNEIKKEISNHRNVYFTKFVNDGLGDDPAKPPSKERLKAYDIIIEKFTLDLTREEIEEAKKSARSLNSNDRVDAYILFTKLAKTNDLDGIDTQSDKLVYLATNPDNILDFEFIVSVENFFGQDLSSLVDGTFNNNKLTREADDFIKAGGYRMDDKVSRMACLREVLFNKSNKTLTIADDGTVLKIVEKKDFLKSRYLGANGDKNFKKDLISGGVKKLSDVCKHELPSFVKDLKIRIESRLRGIRGYYIDGSSEIVLSSVGDTNTLMHEVTHVTQYLTETDFKETVEPAKESLETYIRENFPLTYKHMKANKVKVKHMVYFMLTKELQANSTMTSHMFDAGFKLINDGKLLISPDGKKSWKMNASASKTIDELVKDIAKEYKKRKRKDIWADLSMRGRQKRSRYVSNKVAMQSNLKYFIRKGIPIDLDPGVQDFVVFTTHDFNKLPLILRELIKQGKLTKHKIINYVSTASRINDYTFKAIAKYVYGNEELAKLTFKKMNNIIDNIERFTTLYYMGENQHKVMTLEEMSKLNKEAIEKVRKDDKFAKKWLRANKKAQSDLDTKQLNSLFFRHYKGTLASIQHINNYGKLMSSMQESVGLVEGAKTKSGKRWNWVYNMKRAEIDYEASEVAESLSAISRVEKITAIENYIADVMAERIEKVPKEQRKAMAKDLFEELDTKISKLHDLSDNELSERYLLTLKSESISEEKRPIEPMVAKPKETKHKTNRKNTLRNLGRTLTERIAGLKTRYNVLSPEVKANLDPKTYKLTHNYRSLNDKQLENLISKFAEDSKKLYAKITMSQKSIATREKEKEHLAKMTTKLAKEKQKVESLKGEIKKLKSEKKTYKEKIRVEYSTTIKEQKFEFVTSKKANSIVKEVLDTSWDKTRKSTVKALSNNKEENIANGKTFFEQNSITLGELALSGATIGDIVEAVEWFLEAKMNNVSDVEYKKFMAIKLYFLGHVFSESTKDGLYKDLDGELRNRIENTLKSEVTTAGTMLAVWNNIKNKIDPIETMKNANLELDGVLLSDDEKDKLFEAAREGNIKDIVEIQNKIMDRVKKEKTAKKSILRKITSIRAMSMLSSPLTWLRNRVSNISLKSLYKWSDRIGARLWTGKTIKGQLKLNKKVTPEIKAFIEKHFIDNKLFDTIIKNLSKYNPSDVSRRSKDTQGKINKDAMFAEMVIKSMYNEYYNSNMFDKPFMNTIYKKLMKMLSDDSYIREAAIRYFEKLIAEKEYDVKLDKVTDEIMNDFGKAIGMAMHDYMRSNNMFNKIENWLSDSTDQASKELMLFAYKTILPFASASWQWAKAALKLTPFGLGRAIFNMARLEKRVKAAEDAWAKGESQIAPELTEFIARRDLGLGVIGTIGFCLGMILAGLGHIELEDDDYGIPKLRIGNIRIDVQDIFGSSSVLAGAGLITSFNEDGVTWDSFIEGLNRMVDVTIDNIPLMQIVEMDMYSSGGFSMGMNQLESIALSYIPNILTWAAGATYSGKLDRKTFIGKATAKIPFLGPWFNERKVDPYTGGQGSWWDAFNRVVPYFSLDVASQTEKTTKGLGLNKKELRGNYTVNNEEFKVSGADLTLINQMYGKWNAVDIEAFYKNKTKIKVKVGNTYRNLSFNQMDDDQRKRAVQSVMSNNAELAKIMAWIKAGNKYYASASMYALLRRRGVTSNVYRGTKGFVSK